ncbi:MAG TPA: hypothetical protein VFD32_04355 [Dehalococcoidia bacterium]|nr:hypothetical protein [Dehalococcoidia bacterium]
MAERRPPLSDAELEGALRELSAALDFPPTPDLAARLRTTLPPFRQRRRLWLQLPRLRLAGAALLFVVAITGLMVLLVPATRNAVADRLGLRGVHIRLVPRLTPAPAPSATPAVSPAPASATAAAPNSITPAATPNPLATLQLGEPATLQAAEQAAGFHVLVPAALGPPDAVYLDRTAPGGAVTLVYTPRPDLPASPITGVGLLLTEFRGAIEPDFLGKGVGPDTTLTPLSVGGEPGWWLAGAPHAFFYHAPDGQVRPDRIRLAGNTLLWEQGPLTLRLEAKLTRDAAVRIAESAR